MTAQILDGELVAATIKADLVSRVEALADRGITPGLGTILVGDDGPSANYVAMKHRDCAELGITSRGEHLPATRHPGRRPRRRRRLQRRSRGRRGADPVPVPGRHRLRDGPHAPRPGQGRRRPAPGQPGPARHGHRGPGGLHPGRHPGPAGALRHPHRRTVTWSSSAAVSRSVVPSPTCSRSSGRAPTPRSPSCTPVSPISGPTRARPTSSSPPPGRPGSSRPTWSSPARSSWAPGVKYEGRKVLPDVVDEVAEVASWMSPRIGGVGPMTRALLYRNTSRRPSGRPAEVSGSGGGRIRVSRPAGSS